MLRPYTGSLLPEGKQIFNYRLSRARRVIENTFGKFHIFRQEIIAKPEKMTKITKAACCLHSYLRIAENTSPPSRRSYCPPGYIDCEDDRGNVTGRLEIFGSFTCSTAY